MVPQSGAGHLRFVISNPDVHCVLMGARSKSEVEANVAAVEKGPLPEELLRSIDAVAGLVAFRPFEEPFRLPFGGGYRGPAGAPHRRSAMRAAVVEEPGRLKKRIRHQRRPPEAARKRRGNA